MMSKLNPIQVLRATTRTVTVGSLAMLPFSVMAANSDAAIVTMLIQPKNYAEVYLAYVKPAVSAKVEAEATGTELNSDNVTPSSLAHSLTVKYAVKDDLNLVFQMDKPAAENLDYSVIDPKYPFAKSDVENNKQTVLGMLQFHVNDRIQLFGGPVYEKLSASAELNIGFETGDSSAVLTRKASGDYTFGYVAGFALSNAPTASQLSLSYNSEIEHSTAATELTSLSTFGFNTDSESVSDVEAYSPQSLTLTLQSGISQGTLAFGSIKWSDSGYTSLSTAMLNADNTDEQTVEEVPQSTKFEAGEL